MSDSILTPQEQAAAIAAEWRENLQFVERLQKRARFEYVSKSELREIARGALDTLYQMYTQAVARAEEAANAPAESKIIVPGSDALLTTSSGSILTP